MDISLKIKLYGESFKIHKLKIDFNLLPLFQNVANKLEEPLHSALLNIDFFSILNMKEFETLNHVIDYTFSGLINNRSSQIEINTGRKRIDKFGLNVLFRPTTIFPLYQTKQHLIDTNKLSSGYYIVEKEIGLIGVYEIAVKDFRVDSLKFYLTEITLSDVNYELLNIITYENVALSLIKSDALLRYQNCFLLE